jgi:hypothetical protein
MLTEVLVVITMDVEVPRQQLGASGPADWDESDRAIRGYAALATEAGFPISFFLHPETADRHAGLMHELRDQYGAFIDGLHLHPWKYAHGRWLAHFGGLSAAQQHDAVVAARQDWTDAFGRQPLYFRPGAEPDPHRGHRVFRQQVGDMDFANVPLTHDYTQPVTHGRRFCYRDLRPDTPGVDYEPMLRNIIEQLQQRGPLVPIVHMDTHNDHDYSNPNDVRCPRRAGARQR